MEIKSRVLADMEVSGSLKFTGGVLFEGKFTGGLIEGDSLVVGETAEIRADIIVGNLTIFGRVDGDVDVSEKCQLRPTAHLYGNLKTQRIAMDEGATFAGGMTISQGATAGGGGIPAGAGNGQRSKA
jgi:cytoskeletal protein CcmA (bactofilin family)